MGTDKSLEIVFRRYAFKPNQPTKSIDMGVRTCARKPKEERKTRLLATVMSASTTTQRSAEEHSSADVHSVSSQRVHTFKNLGRQENELREKRREEVLSLRKHKRETDVRSLHDTV